MLESIFLIVVLQLCFVALLRLKDAMVIGIGMSR